MRDPSSSQEQVPVAALTCVSSTCRPVRSWRASSPTIQIFWAASTWQSPTGPSAFIVGGGTGNTNLSSSATRFVPMFSSNSNASEAAVNVAVPVAGTLSNLDVRLDGAAGASTPYTFNIRINGGDAGNAACTITGATATSCTDAVTSMAVAAGDLLSIRVVPSSNPTQRRMRWSAKFSAGP